MAAVAQQGAGVSTVPSPTNGVDFYSPIFGMPPESAIRLTNWWPEVYGNTHRRGYEVWADALPGSAGFIFSYHTQTAGSHLHVFCADGGLYDVTSKDTVAPPPARVAKVSGLNTPLWTGTSFANPAGTHKILVSGLDNPIWMHQTAPPAIVYDRIAAGDGTAGTISGFDPKGAIDVVAHQKRLWFVEKDSTKGWYAADVEVVTGVYKPFDFGPLFSHGGYLQSLATWTVDDGSGSDDLLVAFGSMGDIAVYAGINPESTVEQGDWKLKGVFYVGPLIAGQQFYTKVNGDIKFMTTQGMVSMNDMLSGSRSVPPQANVEIRPVQQFLSEQASQYGFLQGWDVEFFAGINMLVVNIPSVVEGGALQAAENVVNSRWTTFLGMDANSWCPDFQKVPFFTMDDKVCRAWTGHVDHVTIADPKGIPITALVQQAYNFFGSPAISKQIGIYRPHFLKTTHVAWKSSIVYDYGIEHYISTPAFEPHDGYVWDTALWDSALWGGGLHLQYEWAHAEGCGFNASLVMATRSSGEVIWASTDYTLITGGVL